jgi:hypothetical protein
MRKIILINFLVLAFLILCVEAFSFFYLHSIVEKRQLSIAAGNTFVADLYSSKRRLLEKYKKLAKEGSNVIFFQNFYDVNNWNIQEEMPQGCEAFGDSQKLYLQNPGNTTIVFGEETDGVITYVTDKFGFRNPPDQVDRSKVLFVGDSFTEDPLCLTEKRFQDVLLVLVCLLIMAEEAQWAWGIFLQLRRSFHSLLSRK